MTTQSAEDGLLIVETRELMHGLVAVLYRQPGPAPPRKKIPPTPPPRRHAKARRTKQ